ncbi:MAG: type II toxin-antitoxin system RelE/ParE family toxin [Magnetococcales bacterium]|nr:type II toxin-antitoxin system RelE/ParE family toxin [Magnetococcales bacterium]
MKSPSATLSPQARRDLIEIIKWLAERNPDAAYASHNFLDDALGRLGDYPEIGFTREELADPPVQFLSMAGSPYILVYDADERPPLVLRVLHGARDLPELLQDD